MRSAFMRGVAVAISVFVATAAAWAGVQGPAGHVGSVKADGRARLQEVTVERMQTMIRRHLENHRNTKVTEIQVTILDPTESVMIPSGSLEGRIISNSLDAGYGRRGFDLALFVKGKQAETVRVFADVAAIGEVVTATRMIRPDETIAAEDVTMTRVKFSGAPQDVVANPDEAIGKRAVKPIRPEAPILFSMLAQPYA
ncbi:MAG: flagellar basal body P-ring formation chaperone FlgA, partial [Nitrospiraceae bacterium]